MYKFYHPFPIQVIIKNPQSLLFIIVAACLLALFGCAPSGGGGSGSDEIKFANITLGSGQYSGYYTLRSSIVSENISCADGRSTFGYSEYLYTNAALSHQGSRLSIYHINTGEVTMTGSVVGNQFQLAGALDGTGALLIKGTFASFRLGWSGTFAGTLTSGTFSGCSFSTTFAGTRSDTHPYIGLANHLGKTSRRLLSEDDLNKEGISKIEQYFGSPMSSD